MILIVLFVILLIIYFIIPDAYVGTGYTDDDDWNSPLLFENVITPEECAEIINESIPKFQQSEIVGSNDSIRTSQTAWLPKTFGPARKILEFACKLTGKSLDYCEDLQVVKYEPGMYYKPHHDSCCDDDLGCKSFQENGGHRIGTLIVYLNNEFEEGYTHFPNIDQIFRGPPGGGMFFRPLDRDGKKCHRKALHGGMSPKKGTKYVCNAWVRENKIGQ